MKTNIWSRLATLVCVLLLGAGWIYVEMNKIWLKAAQSQALHERKTEEFKFKVFKEINKTPPKPSLKSL